MRLLQRVEQDLTNLPSVKAVKRTAKEYVSFCRTLHVRAFPPSYSSVAGYLCHYFQRNNDSAKSLDTVQGHIHTFCRYSAQPWLSAEDLYKVTKVRRRLEFEDVKPVKQKRPLTGVLLSKILQANPVTCMVSLLLATMLYLGHDGLFRSGEILNLKVSDVEWNLVLSTVTIILHRSKAHRRGPPERVSISKYPGPCAYRLLKKWFKANQLYNQAHLYVFPLLVKPYRVATYMDFSVPKTKRQWYADIKSAVASIGLDPALYAGQSLRAGGATDLFGMGVPKATIMKMGRWSSEEVMKYYRDPFEVADTCAIAFGKAVSYHETTLGVRG